ncbi:hypothetical protein PISMIDRAFT_11279 [Pisolithus microcarpus 441]|uniref:DUF6534 domain-containing protein n=1 Tax=Pisolithus microcarpus 441 TaxID=765257 RepID=A0A0C9ZKF3_9AGAM|nr:hypothetical protein PISMIDRAFT_11279 [Pisolithus microcarpus 441]
MHMEFRAAECVGSNDYPATARTSVVHLREMLYEYDGTLHVGGRFSGFKDLMNGGFLHCVTMLRGYNSTPDRNVRFNAMGLRVLFGHTAASAVGRALTPSSTVPRNPFNMGIPGGFGFALIGGLLSAMVRNRFENFFHYDTYSNQEAGSAVAILVNNALDSASETKFYTSTPATFAVVLAEVLITVSLCILLYDSGSCSPFPRTKRLLKALIVYAVNRCLLTLIVTVAEVIVVADANCPVSLTMALEFIVGKLYANSLLASLNVREHLRSQDSIREPDLRSNAICLANLPRFPDMRTSRDGTKGVHECEVAVRVDIATEQVSDKTSGSICDVRLPRAGFVPELFQSPREGSVQITFSFSLV